MKNKPLVSAMLLIMAAAPLCVKAQSARELEERFRRQYVGSERMMRNFYAEFRLKFDSQGNLTSKSPTGSWTIFGRVVIDRLELQARSLKLEGHRNPVVFVEESQKWKPIPWDGRWTMEIATQPGPEQSNQLEAALQKIFLSASEDPATVMPEYWREFIHRLNGQAVPGEPCESFVSEASDGASAPFQISEGVSDGMKIRNAFPRYLSYAYANRVEGEVHMRAVISRNGDVTKLCLTHVVGAGLDDEVAKAVQQWKYQAYLLNGSPVEIKTSITVKFHH